MSDRTTLKQICIGALFCGTFVCGCAKKPSGPSQTPVANSPKPAPATVADSAVANPDSATKTGQTANSGAAANPSPAADPTSVAKSDPAMQKNESSLDVNKPSNAAPNQTSVNAPPAKSDGPADDPRAAPTSPKEMLKRVGTGVVLVTVYDALGETVGMGTGCLVGKGRVLTNHHVIASAVTAKVQPKGEGDEALGTALDVRGFLILDAKNDLAVL
jgi:S1-C subfamily serine protease